MMISFELGEYLTALVSRFVKTWLIRSLSAKTVAALPENV